MSTYKDLIESFKTLSNQEKEMFVSIVMRHLNLQADISSIKSEITTIKPITCPHCTSRNIIANGKLRGVQRYKCKECQKNFSENTGTALAWIKKQNLWGVYIKNMFEGYSLEKCAKLTGICKQTSFDWRHKILSSLREKAPVKFSGITEVDDIFFNYSEKGSRNLTRKARKRGNDNIKQGISNDKVAVLVVCDRNKNKELQLVKRGRIRKKDLEKNLLGKLDTESPLCTDGHRSFTGYAKDIGIEVHSIKVRKGQHVKDKIYHLQNVNQTTSGLKKWLSTFNGVATKYLQNYLYWYMLLEQIKNKEMKLKEFALAALISNQAWITFKNIAMNHMEYRL